MTEPATVFVSNMVTTEFDGQWAPKDFSPAAKYGAIRPVTSGNYPIFKTARLQQEVIEALIHSKETDYLLLSGSSIIAGLCLAVWLEMHSVCNMLLYSRAQRGYVLRTVGKSTLRQEIERARDNFEQRRQSAGT